MYVWSKYNSKVREPPQPSLISRRRLHSLEEEEEKVRCILCERNTNQYGG